MKVVALVSGGKDSCYAMMRCVDYGHEIVALANLLPLDDSVDELDSYMYQTVGHQVVAAYAECMGLPLFRRRIQGSTRDKHLDYKATTGDEVEDMYILLSEVKQKIPSISAVSSGAIASDYQRLRVESVCSRLGLVSLAYLWKKDQTLLLEEMVQRGIVAITVKVAALGLNPAKHLGKEIADLQSSLLQLHEIYGINVCGEGGEYESLTLDCPLFLNARIVIDKFQVIMHSTDSIAPVGILHPLSFHIEGKKTLSSISSMSSISGINSKGTGNVFQVQGDCIPIDVANNQTLELLPDSTIMEDKVFHISTTNRNKFSLACWVPTSLSEGLQEDLEAVLRIIESQLVANGFGWANVLYIHLYISDMDAFALANEIYLRFITEKKCVLGVPSRSTIELPLAQAGLGNALVEVLVAHDDRKKVLHVQSISCWAPSCIGPYSQATLHKDILFMAGQLGLDPPTMMLCSGSPIAQLEQALENCDAVAKCFNCCIASSAILLVTYCSASTTPSDRVDIQRSIEVFLSQESPGLHNGHFSTACAPMFLYVLASDLPKRALVEMKPIFYASENINAVDLTAFPEAGCARTPPCWDFGHYRFCDLCCQKFIVCGRMCSAVVSITKEIAAELCSLSGQDAAHIQHCNSNNHIRRISKFCIYILHRTLVEAKIPWEDLMSLRIYFLSTFSASIDALNVAFLESFNELAGFSNSIQAVKKPFFSFIPVLSVGKSSTMDDLITCEMFASKS